MAKDAAKCVTDLKQKVRYKAAGQKRAMRKVLVITKHRPLPGLKDAGTVVALRSCP
jgi:hypothetical protein